MNFFRYNIVVAAYPVSVYVVSRAGRHLPPCTRNNVFKLTFENTETLYHMIPTIVYELHFVPNLYGIMQKL